LRAWRAQLRLILEGLAPDGTLPDIDWDAFVQIQREALEPYLANEIARGVTAGAQSLGLAPGKAAATVKIDWNQINQSAVLWASSYTYELIKDITATTRDKLSTAISDWLNAGEAFPDLRRRVEEIFEDPARAELIAVTESTRAVAEGNTQLWQAANVKARTWETAVDELVCPICGGLNLNSAPLGQSFTVKVSGKTYTIPNPPAHPGCRCAVKPKVSR